MILGVCKNMGVTPDYVLHHMTYENVTLYSHATPSYDPDDYKEDNNQTDFDSSLDANNPDNFTDSPDEEIITSLH